MKKRQPLRSKQACFYCTSEKQPDYKNVDELRQYVTDRGKIVSRRRTGICAKHQRHLAQEIKRARHIAQLPFVVKV